MTTDRQNVPIVSAGTPTSNSSSPPNEGNKTSRVSQPIIGSGQPQENPTAQNKLGAPENSKEIISSGVPLSGAVSQPLHFLVSITNGPIQLNGSIYQIIKCISKSGEAEVFLVEKDGVKTVLKLYYPNCKPKAETINKIKGLRHPDILYLIDCGFYYDRFFEVSEFAEGGSLLDCLPIRDLVALKAIVAETVNGLHHCHNDGLYHRDIKPHNLLFRKADKTDLVIGDFGISSVLDEGMSRNFTTRSQTKSYAAPEYNTQIEGRVLLGPEVDYYALGITLIHIWTGEDPFKNMPDHTQFILKSMGKVPIPAELPQTWQTLIKGLITVDVKQRWGYEEVQKWLKGEPVPLHFKTIEVPYSPFVFDRQSNTLAQSPSELVLLMSKDPEKGKRLLYKGTIADWLKNTDQDLCASVRAITEDEYPRDQEAGLIKAIYVLDPNYPFKGLNETILLSNEEIAAHFELNHDHYQKELQNPRASFFLYLEARNNKAIADSYRSLFQNSTSQTTRISSKAPSSANFSNTAGLDRRSSCGLELISHLSSGTGQPGSTSGSFSPTVSISQEAALNYLIFRLQGGNRFDFENLHILQPEEILLLSENKQDLILKDLVNPDSKISIWVNACFPDLMKHLIKWRSLGRFTVETLSFPLSGSFRFAGVVIRSEDELVKFLIDKLESLIQRKIEEAFVRDADYWLVNYAGSSLLTCFSTLIATNPHLSEVQFAYSVKYICSHYSIEKDNIYPLLEKMLPNLRENTRVKQNSMRDVVEGFSRLIKSYLEEMGERNPQFIEACLTFSEFIEKNAETFPQFFRECLNVVASFLIDGIQKDLKALREKGFSPKSYVSLFDVFIKRLNRTAPDIELISWHKNLNSVFPDVIAEIKARNLVEAESKEKIVEEKYGEILKSNVNSFLAVSSSEFSQKVFAVVAAFLMVLCSLYIYGLSDKEAEHFIWNGEISGFLSFASLLICGYFLYKGQKK